MGRAPAAAPEEEEEEDDEEEDEGEGEEEDEDEDEDEEEDIVEISCYDSVSTSLFGLRANWRPSHFAPSLRRSLRAQLAFFSSNCRRIDREAEGKGNGE